jgi:hypothetical protein
MEKKLHIMPKLTQCPKKEIPGLKSIANQETLTNLIYYKEQATTYAMAVLMKKKLME